MLALKDRWIWDFWLARDGAHWHVFFLQAPKSIGDPELRHWNVSIGHATSDDLKNWSYRGTCFGPAAGPAWDDHTTWTGSVVRDDDVHHAVRALHEAFPLARLRAHVCLIGTGRVGKKLLDIMAAQAPDLLDRVGMNMRLTGLANSRRMVATTSGLSISRNRFKARSHSRSARSGSERARPNAIN